MKPTQPLLTMKKKTFSTAGKVLFILCFLGAHVFILNNLFTLSKDMLYGDFSAEEIKPAPKYGFMRIPAGPAAETYDAQNHIAQDFAQIYFPAQEFSSMSKTYQSGYLDPWRRPSRYAPAIHYLCSLTLCRLEYGYASLIHVLTQLLLFYVFFALAHKILGVAKYLPLGFLLANICLFLTPTGISWFERGQFSLYVATSYLLLTAGMLKKDYRLILLSVFFAFIKWTAFLYFFVVLAIFILSSRDFKEGKKNFFIAAAMLLVVIALSLLFPQETYYFLLDLLKLERFAIPRGVSLTLILPVNLVKSMPLVLLVIGFFHIWRQRSALARYIPYFTGAAILLLTYQTKAYEYGLPTLLCFLPFIFYWTDQPDIPVPRPVREVLKYTFLAFMLLAGYSDFIRRLFQMESSVIGGYILMSAMLLFTPLFFNPGSASAQPAGLEAQ